VSSLGFRWVDQRRSGLRGTAPSFRSSRVASALRAAVNGARCRARRVVGLPGFASRGSSTETSLRSRGASSSSAERRVTIESDESGSRLVTPTSVHIGPAMRPRVGPPRRRRRRAAGLETIILILRGDAPSLRDIRNECATTSADRLRARTRGRPQVAAKASSRLAVTPCSPCSSERRAGAALARDRRRYDANRSDKRSWIVSGVDCGAIFAVGRRSTS